MATDEVLCTQTQLELGSIVMNEIFNTSFCVCCILFSSMSPCFAQQLEQGEEQIEAKEEKPLEVMLLREVKAEVRKVCEIDFSLEISRLEDFFELDNEASDRFREGCDRSIEDYLGRIQDEQICMTCMQMMDVGDELPGFELNGRKHVLEGQEDEMAIAAPKISLCLYKSRIVVVVEDADGMGTSTSMMAYDQTLNDDLADILKETVPELTEGDWNRFSEHRTKEKLERVVSLLMATLEVELKLSDEQLEPAREWVRSSLDKGLAESELMAAATLGLRQLDGSPGFLTEVQKKVLKLLQIDR